jgi:hypothetical protein
MQPTHLSLLVALVGLFLYLAANRGEKPTLGPKAGRVGEIMLFCGLLATLMRMDASSFRLH